MSSNLPLRFVAFAVAAMSLPACVTGAVDVGSDEQKLSAPPEQTDDAGCTKFCDIATPKGCPMTGDCIELCAAERALSTICKPRSDDLLACAAPLLDAACGLDLVSWDVQNGPACDGESYAYHDCLQMQDPSTIAFAFWNTSVTGVGSTRFPSTNPLVWTSIESDIFGTAGTLCDDRDGSCVCKLDDEEYARCQTLINGFDSYRPTEGCCAEGLPFLWTPPGP